MLKEENLAEKINSLDRVTTEIRNKYFKGKNFKYIRDWLENHNINKHTFIELECAGVAILISKPGEIEKVLVQIRSSEDNRMGFFGGGIEDGESSIDAAIRELKEESGIEISGTQLEFIEINEHDLEYKNGDKVFYKSYIYLLKLDYYPFIKIDNESNGFMLISKENYKNFTYLKDTKLFQLQPYLWETLVKILKL